MKKIKTKQKFKNFIPNVNPKTRVLGSYFILLFIFIYYFFLKGQKGGGEVILFLIF